MRVDRGLVDPCTFDSAQRSVQSSFVLFHTSRSGSWTHTKIPSVRTIAYVQENS